MKSLNMAYNYFKSSSSLEISDCLDALLKIPFSTADRNKAPAQRKHSDAIRDTPPTSALLRIRIERYIPLWSDRIRGGRRRLKSFFRRWGLTRSRTRR